MELNETRLEILKHVAEAESTPKEIAEKTGNTLANSSYQLKLLEASGYLYRKKASKGKGSRKKTDRRILYGLQSEIAIINTIHPLSSGRKEIKLKGENEFLTNILFKEIPERKYILKFWYQHDNLITKIDGMLLKDINPSEVHLFIITKDVDVFRENNKIVLNSGGEEKILVFWSHTEEEVREGIKNKDPYFMNSLYNSKFLYEKNQAVRKLK